MNELAKLKNNETSLAREVSQVQGQILMAKKFPRNEREAIERIKNACTREGLASVAIYQYSRGGTDIQGASIRLAEAVAQNWGNIDFGIREISQDDGESVVEAYAWDLETNTRQTKIFVVPHIRYSRNYGNKELTDPRDIYELVANNGARRLRACILGVIPGDVVEMAVVECQKTLVANCDISPERIKKMIGMFNDSFKVTKAQIENFIGRSTESITAALMTRLIKVYNSLKDGMSDPSDWFKDLPDANSENLNFPKDEAPKKETKQKETIKEPEQVKLTDPGF